MTGLIASSVQFAEPESQLWSAPPAEATHVFRLTQGPGQQVWLGDEDVVPGDQLDGGAIWIDAPLAEGGIPSNISMTPGLTSGESNISGGTYKFLDDKGELDTWLQDKSANGYQLFGGTLEHFIIERGGELLTEDDISRARWYTWLIKGSISLDGRVYGIKCEDINRNVDQDVFEKRSHALMQTVTADGTNVQIYLTDDEAADLSTASWVWKHGADYHVHPGENRAIGLLSDSESNEYISWTGLEDSGKSTILPEGIAAKWYTLLNVRRGLFGTAPREWSVDSDQSLSSRKQIMAVPYAEEHPLSMARAVYCSKTLDDRAFPWGLGLPDKWLDVPSLVAASRDTYKLRITVRSPKKQKGKSFVEEHCLARRGIMVVNSRGALSYVPAPIGTGAPSFELSEENCSGADISALTHDDTDTAISTIIAWDLDPTSETYRKHTEFTEPDALGEISATESVTVEAPYLTTNRSTEGEVLAQGRVLHSRHARPVKRLTVRPEWGMAHYSPGTIAQVSLPIKDYSGDAPSVADLKLNMMIASVKRDHHNQSLRWDLVGFRPLPKALTTMPTAQLPASEYVANGIPIVSSGGVASLSQPIQLGRKYYHLSDLTLPDGWPGTLTGRGDLEIWVRGTLLWGADVDLTGLGGLGGAGANANGASGQRGGVPAPMPSGSVSVRVERSVNSGGIPQSVTVRYMSSRPPSDRYNVQTVNPISVSVERGRLVGLPASLMGSGGSGGDGSVYRGPGEPYYVDTGTVAGGNGGNGSGSIKLVCSAGSGFVGDGAMRLNGEDGESVGHINYAYGASGAGGARGQVVILHDTTGTPWGFDSTRLEAINGQSALVGTKARTWSGQKDTSLTHVRSYYSPINDTSNQWADAVTVSFLPVSEIPQDASYYANSIDQFFANQRDGRVKIIVRTGRPSDANVGDMWITPDELNGTSTKPNAEVLDTNGWRSLNWSTDNRVYEFLLFTAREYGGNVVHFGTTRPTQFTDGDLWRDPHQDVTWILHTTGADEILTRAGVEVGDERLVDPNFVLTATAGAPYTQYYYITNDIGELPTVTVPGQGKLTTGDTLQPPFNVRAAVYGKTSAELFWSPPSDLSNVEVFEIFKDGISIDVTADNTATSYLFEGLLAGTTYELGVRGVRGSEFSVTQTQAIITNNATATGASIDSITVSGGYAVGAAPPSDGLPTLTLSSAGPTITLATTNVEDGRKVYIQFTGGYTAGDDAVSSGSVSHTPADPGALAGQEFSAYIENNAGEGVTLAGVSYVST